MSRSPKPLALPEEAHIPGRTPRPGESLFAAIKANLSTAMPPADLARSAAFQGGLDAFFRRYYWEAHELFEAVWRCLPPASAERRLLQGLIQLANAGLKARMARAKAVRRIRRLADASLDEAFLRRQASLMGLTPTDLAVLRRQVDRECFQDDSAI